MNLVELLTLGGQGAGAGIGGVAGTVLGAGNPVGTAVGTTVGAGLGREAAGNLIDTAEAVADGDVGEILELVINPVGTLTGLDIPGIPFI